MKFEPFVATHPRHAEYFQDMPCQVCADTRGIIAVDKNLCTMGAIVFDNFLPNSAQCTIEITNPMCLRKGGLITEAAKYIYDVAKRTYVYVLVRETNEKALNLDYKIGFEYKCNLKDAYEVNEDIVVLSMTKEQCNHYYTELERAA